MKSLGTTPEKIIFPQTCFPVNLYHRGIFRWAPQFRGNTTQPGERFPRRPRSPIHEFQGNSDLENSAGVQSAQSTLTISSSRVL